MNSTFIAPNSVSILFSLRYWNRFGKVSRDRLERFFCPALLEGCVPCVVPDAAGGKVAVNGGPAVVDLNAGADPPGILEF